MSKVMLGHGQFDTRAITLNSGEANPRPEAGQPYDTTTFEEICHMAANPPYVDKGQGDWIIPSDYNGPDGRSHKVQREKGTCQFLWADIDEGSPTFEQVWHAVYYAVGNHDFLIYSSRGAKPDRMKWRVMVPLGDLHPPMSAYTYYAQALNQRLTERGLTPDEVNIRAGQLCYLPARGEFYQYYRNPQPPVVIDTQHPIYTIAAHLHQQHAEETKIAKPKEAYSPRAVFSKIYTAEMMLETYGFETRNGRDWRHPSQSTGSYGTKLDPDGLGWVTASGTIEAMLGRKHGDGFDIYVAMQCGGDEKLAGRFARTLIDGAATAEHGQQIAEGVMKRFQEIEQARISANEEALEAFETAVRTHSNITVLPPLTGFLGRVADWIGHEYMHHRQPEIEKIAALIAAASLVGRKDSFRGAAPVLHCLMFGITGSGKDTVKSFYDKLIDDLTARWPAEFGHDELDVFAGMGLHEGVGSYNNSLVRRLSGVIVLSEAGLAQTSKAGDRTKVKSMLMQNIAGGAYRRMTFTEQTSNKMHKVYGVNHSLFEESTLSAYKDHLNSEAYETGEAARRLFYSVGVNRGNDGNGFNSDKKIPIDILEGFRLLALEALRGEEEAMRAQDQNGITIPGSIPPPYDLRVEYQPDDHVLQDLARMHEEVRQNRLANVNNEAGLDWGHKSGRGTLLIMQISLLLARTDRVVYSPTAAPVVGKEHWECAKQLVLASQATEKGNSDEFQNPLVSICRKMLETAARMFKRGQPSKKYADECGAGRDYQKLFNEHKVPTTFWSSVQNVRNAMDSMADKNNNRKRVWQDVIDHGDQLGYWELEKQGRKQFMVMNLTKLDDE